MKKQNPLSTSIVVDFLFEVFPIRACFVAKFTNSEAKMRKYPKLNVSNLFKLWELFSNSMLNMSAKLHWIIPSRSWKKLKWEKKYNNTNIIPNQGKVIEQQSLLMILHKIYDIQFCAYMPINLFMHVSIYISIYIHLFIYSCTLVFDMAVQTTTQL